MVTFEVVNIGGGKVGLKSVSAGKFIRAIAPGVNGPTWVVVVDAPDANYAGAQFRLERGGDGVAYLWAQAAKGYVNLPVDGTDDVVSTMGEGGEGEGGRGRGRRGGRG